MIENILALLFFSSGKYYVVSAGCLKMPCLLSPHKGVYCYRSDFQNDKQPRERIEMFNHHILHLGI